MQINRLYTVLAVFFVSAFLTGCATPVQPNIPFANSTLNSGSGKVGVAVVVAAKPNTHFPGANCLLCIGTANLIHTSLNAHTAKLSNQEVYQIEADLTKVLQSKGIPFVALPVDMKLNDLPKAAKIEAGFTTLDFKGLQAQYGIDHLLLVQTGAMGFERPFASYVPTAEPHAWVAGSVMMIKLPENRLEWFEPVQIRKNADGAWDEPPSFPGLTSAYYEAIEEFKDRVLVDLKK
ncbi:hypothetical protein [Rhodoferax ferrireducens]|uniref:hypothetical protein n=1 Tax=Rhodoferax ferrireducens TaxID=192843 RepID=UPI00286C3D31|nr:hypothetical protein [Rhodoferax ferrireducens]